MKSINIDLIKQIKTHDMKLSIANKAILRSFTLLVLFISNAAIAQELMEIEGGIKIGSTILMQDGTIRYNGADFEGLVGGVWKSFTTTGETVTTLVNNNNGTFTYTAEDGTITTLDVTAWETITSLVDNNDGTATYISEDGSVTTISTSSETVTTLTDNSDGTYLYTAEDGTTTLLDIPTWETTTTLVDNNDGTATYTSEDGTSTIVDLSQSSIWTESNMLTHLANNNSKVMIGDTSILSTPGNYKLYVEDGILTEKVKVAIESTSDWADDAFYRVPSIHQVEESITKHSHLYNVPSAHTLVAQGYSVTEMDARLLEQTEWLWMHLIALQKENDKLKLAVEKLLKNK